MDRRRLLALAGASATAPLLPRAAHSQSAWPNRPVRLIVPFAPGGGTDGVARIIAARLSEIWGQQMVIENKGGAGSNIGIEHVARSEPDGYTVLIASLPLAINRYIYSSVSYDPVANFAPVTLICLYPNLMIVPNSSPVKSGAPNSSTTPRRTREKSPMRRPVPAPRRTSPASCSSAWPASR